MEKRFKFVTKKNDPLDIKRKKKIDKRGYFERLYCKKEFSKILKTKKIVQINRAFTKKKGTIRGLHFQIGNQYEEKIYPVENKVEVRDLSGAGDTFMAALAVKYTETNDMIMSIEFANQCAAKVVKKKGTTVA